MSEIISNAWHFKPFLERQPVADVVLARRQLLAAGGCSGDGLNDGAPSEDVG